MKLLAPLFLSILLPGSVFSQDNVTDESLAAVCDCPAGYCNQTGCGPFAKCDAGHCIQVGLILPMCHGGWCDQTGAQDPSCGGDGNCCQENVTGISTSCIGLNCKSRNCLQSDAASLKLATLVFATLVGTLAPLLFV